MWGHSRIGVGLGHSLRHTATAPAWVATCMAAKVKVLNMTWVVTLLLAWESGGALMSLYSFQATHSVLETGGRASRVLPADDGAMLHVRMPLLLGAFSPT